MSARIMRLITMHCTEHIERGSADAVWGEALCCDPDVDFRQLSSGTNWRVISFDGRRTQVVTLRTKDFESRRDAEKSFDSKLKAKRREGYNPIDWTQQRFGLLSTLRSIDEDFFNMTVAESTRIGMDISSQLWKSIAGLSGYSVPWSELTDPRPVSVAVRDTGMRFNVRSTVERDAQASPRSSLRDAMQANREIEITQEQARTPGRFAPDPNIGLHVFMWSGPFRDPDFAKCGVCSKDLGKHARLVINYRGRLAKHVFRPDFGNIICTKCGLSRSGSGGTLVHASGNDIEYINAPEATRINSSTGAVTVTQSTQYGSIDVLDGMSEEEQADWQAAALELERIALTELGRMEISAMAGGTAATNKAPSIKPKRADKQTGKEPDTHERTGGILEFDL